MAMSWSSVDDVGAPVMLCVSARRACMILSSADMSGIVSVWCRNRTVSEIMTACESFLRTV